MSNQIRMKLLNTQPHHESLQSDTLTTFRNKSEILLRANPSRRNHSTIQNELLPNHSNKSAPNSAGKDSIRRELNMAKMRRKYRQAHRSHAKPSQQQQLYSPSIGLKVRRAVQEDYDFHSGFYRDEVINYFSSTPCTAIKKKGTRNDIQFRNRQPVKRKIVKEQLRVPSSGDDRQSSQLSGWRVQSDPLKQSSASLDPQSYQIISNYPSINIGFTNNITHSTARSQEEHSATVTSPEEGPDSGVELPDFSLKIVPPSEMNSSVKELISIKIIHQNVPSCNLVAQSKTSVNSCAKLQSKATLKDNCKSQLKLASFKNTNPRSKKTYESLPSNKENCIVEKIEEQMPSTHNFPEPSLLNKGLLRGIMDSGKISVSYSEDYVCSQKLDENDGLSVSEREESRAFKFQRSYKPAPPAPTVAPVPAVSPTEISMKKEKERRSIVIEKIEQFGSNCKNFFSSLADRINPFHEEKIQEESDITESILALRTLNSHADLDSHFSPRQLRVQIREPTLLQTQGWGMQSVLEERLQTVHEIRTTMKDFSSEVRIALSSNGQRESFYSQEYLKAHSDEAVSRALGKSSTIKEVIAEETSRAMQQNFDSLLDKMYSNQSSKQQIKDEVACSLELLEGQIMEHLLG